MVYVTKPDGVSYMHIYDAATMDSTPVAEVSEAARDHNTLSGTRLVERGAACVRALLKAVVIRVGVADVALCAGQHPLIALPAVWGVAVHRHRQMCRTQQACRAPHSCLADMMCCGVACCPATVPVQVKLPQRVPHGFHAMWVTGQQIKQQQLPGLALQAAK